MNHLAALVALAVAAATAGSAPLFKEPRQTEDQGR